MKVFQETRRVHKIRYTYNIRNTLWINYWNSLLCEITCKICQYQY